MAVSASIYNAIGQGVTPLQDPQNALLKAMRMQGAQEEMQAQRMTRARTEDEYRRGVERSNRLQQLLSGEYADDEARAGALVKGGFIDEGQKLLKGNAEIAGKRATTAKTLTETQAAQIAQHRDMLADVNDPQTAMQWAQIGLQSGVLDGAKYQLALQNIQRAAASPEAFNAWKTQAALGATKFIEMNKPTYQTRNTGGSTDTIALPGLIGAPSMVNSVQNTQSPDSVAAQEAARRKLEQEAKDAEADRRLRLRGQDLVDNRSREANKIAGSLTDQKKQLEVDALKDKAAERERSKQAAVSSVESQIRVIDKALAHPGMKTATGLSGTIDPRNYIAGTDATDFRVVLDQIGGAAFLQAFESLKGGGAITEVEGKKATDAIARLNRAQSDSEFETSLNDLRGVMETGYKRLAGRDYARPNAPARAAGGRPARIASDAEYNALPSGAMFVGPDGKTRRKP